MLFRSKRRKKRSQVVLERTSSLLWFAAAIRFMKSNRLHTARIARLRRFLSPLPFLTLNFSCDRVREIRSTAPVRRRPFYITASISSEVTGTHSRLTKQDTGYAQRRSFARTLSSIAPRLYIRAVWNSRERQRPPLL